MNGLAYNMKGEFISREKGDAVKVLLKKTEAPEEEYVEKSGFEEGFDDAFSSDILYKEESVGGNLENCVKIIMNSPVNYYDRYTAAAIVAAKKNKRNGTE